MKRTFLKLSAVVLATLLIAPVAIHAQDDGDKDKEKDKSEKKGAEQIIITKKGDNNDKVVVEINGDKVTVNGKPIEDLKEGDISVNVHKLKNGYNNSYSFNWNGNDNMFFSENENTAMLGVVTDKVDEGVKITDVTDESGASKAGLKEDDIITKVDDKKIDDPDDLTKIIRGHKPGDKVTITYLRDKKEEKATAELTKWKGGAIALGKMPSMDWNVMTPRGQTMPKFKMSPGQYYAFGENRPRLGLSVQDTEDGKGVKVVDVDEDGSGQKAGVKEDDIIVAVNDKEVNSADEVAKIVRDNKDKPSVMLKIKRDNKTQNIEVKIPRKLKTEDL
ncbi:MAG TPA: PDZ domain-containing protein [Chitinophagaceae bacterium]|jgi:serine protease Do